MTTATTAPPAARLRAPIEAWLDELRRARRLSPRTLDAYARDLGDYTGFATQHRLAAWDEATLTFIDGYFASLDRRGLSASTVSRRRSTLRGFHGFLARTGQRHDDPIALLPAPRRSRRLPHALTLGDVEALLAHPQGDQALALRDRALLEVAYGSGLRVSELVGLDRRNLDLAGRALTVTGKSTSSASCHSVVRPSMRCASGWSAAARNSRGMPGTTSSSSTPAAARCRAWAGGRCCRGWHEVPGSPRMSTLMCSGTRSRPTSCKVARICGSCRSCSCMRMSPPPPSTPTSIEAICARCIGSSIRGPESGPHSHDRGRGGIMKRRLASGEIGRAHV